MRDCTFVKDGTIGPRKVKAGETVALPEAFVQALIRRGVATDSPSPVITPSDASTPEPLSAPPPAGSGDSTGPVEERITKPAQILSKRALKKLFKRKVTQ